MNKAHCQLGGLSFLLMGAILSLVVLSSRVDGAPPPQKGGREQEIPKVDLQPLTVPGFYEKDGKKFEKGLYAGGGNEMPEEHRKAGEEIAKSLVPLNEKGEPDKNGSIVALAVGHSNSRDCFNAMMKILPDKQKEGVISPQFRLASIAHGGHQALEWVEALKAHKLSSVAKSAQVVFLLTTYHTAGRAKNGPYFDILQMPFEKKMLQMKGDLTTIVQELTVQCPKLKMIYIGMDSWRGFARLEPEVFEEGFAYKWLIDDQIKGAPELAFQGPNRKAAWLGWGGYLWEPNAPKERYKDGVHASEDVGIPFVVGRWMDALGSDSTTRPWMFVKPVENKK